MTLTLKQTWHDPAFNYFNLNLTNIDEVVVVFCKINELEQYDYIHLASKG